ncbi:MAG: alpha/beta hydrolase [Acidimicrobiia bacterium]
MKGLQAPPKEDTPARIAARMAVLVVLLIMFAIFIWAAVTNQQIPLVEDLRPDAVGGLEFEVTERATFRVDDRGDGETPVFLLHDVNLAGGALFESLVNSLEGQARTVAVDLPGFGFSTRFPFDGPVHTVSGMAERLIPVIEARSGGPVVLVGVGMGGKIAAELAASRPDLVAGLVMIDVDFYDDHAGWVQAFERMPWLGTAVTHAFEVSGAFSDSSRHPYCEEGGHCLTLEQSRVRDLAEEIAGTSHSLQAFRSTPAAAIVPSRFVDITAPTVVVWSTKGKVSEESIDRLIEGVAGASLETVDAFEAVHEAPDRIAALIAGLIP